MKTIDDIPDDSNTVILCFSSIKISGIKIEIVSSDIHLVNAEAGFQTDASNPILAEIRQSGSELRASA